ncbi:MAG TPA: putative Na+/H+ antiporter [Terriglobia bacterium]|nr:putative Na+/H+ antiporter [Terriglobia bacterium]
MRPSPVEILAAALFLVAVVHTFFVKKLRDLSLQYPEATFRHNFLHLLGEVEIVFGFWAGILVLGITFLKSGQEAIRYVDSVNFTEAVFVFVVMSVAGTRPIIDFASRLIGGTARILPMSGAISFYLVALIVGPLLGSFITEPAAITVTALILRDRFMTAECSERFRYGTLAVLFTNVSIGGVLTSFAAPPVLMVAGVWNWDFRHMVAHFGWKAAVAVLINASLVTVFFRKEIDRPAAEISASNRPFSPFWMSAVHLIFLGVIVATLHHATVFLFLFLFFLGFTTVTKEQQDDLNLNGSLLVGFFLAGLVVLGGLQSWWLAPLIRNLKALPLFLGTAGLTAFTDNAALTFLGAQIPNVSEEFKYALVAGAIAGGGLTVIANAPNPAGFAILSESFGPAGIGPGRLFKTALIPVGIAMLCLWALPNL